MRTVRELLDEINPQIMAVVDAAEGPEPTAKEMNLFSFWKRLYRLSYEKTTVPLEHCNDIDAAAHLTEEEYQQLKGEFEQLMA